VQYDDNWVMLYLLVIVIGPSANQNDPASKTSFAFQRRQQTLRISTISRKIVPVHSRADVITSSLLQRRPQQNGKE